MRDKIIQRILGVLLILTAIYSMDFSHWNSAAVFFMMLFSGASSILKSSASEFYQKMGHVFHKTAFVIAIITLARMLFIR